MPARDIIHMAVKNALVKDGWTITHDPYTIHFDERDFFVDLAAERVIAAERGNDKIAVEVKSFVGRSKVRDLEEALGQYLLYLNMLTVVEPDRRLYIAVTDDIYDTVFTQAFARLVLDRYQVPLIVINPETEEVIQWTK